MILDTCVLIDVMSGEPEAVEAVRIAENAREQVYLSARTLFELYQGIPRAPDSEQEQTTIEQVLGTKEVLAADARVMKKAGRVYGELVADGARIDAGDCIIGATGVVHEQPVLTRNTAHFERIPGLEIREY
jgi:predicted nucleic acid-binding protein